MMRGGQGPPKKLYLSFVFLLWSKILFRGRRVEEGEHPNMTAPAGRGQEKVMYDKTRRCPLGAAGYKYKMTNKQTPAHFIGGREGDHGGPL